MFNKKKKSREIGNVFLVIFIGSQNYCSVTRLKISSHNNQLMIYEFVFPISITCLSKRLFSVSLFSNKTNLCSLLASISANSKYILSQNRPLFFQRVKKFASNEIILHM